MKSIFYRLYVQDMYSPKFEGSKEFILNEFNKRVIKDLPAHQQDHMKITYCTEQEVDWGL
jgi:peptidoglycan hydrolase-like amidase